MHAAMCEENPGPAYIVYARRTTRPRAPAAGCMYDGGGTYWYVGSSDRLNDCNGIGDSYLASDLNPGRPGDARTWSLCRDVGTA